MCLGDCDVDDDCKGNLVCFQRDKNEAVPGCDGGEDDGTPTDYCIADPSQPTRAPSVSTDGTTVNADSSLTSPFGMCRGDGNGNNDCKGNLVCFQRDKNEAVPGCDGGADDGTPTDDSISDPS